MIAVWQECGSVAEWKFFGRNVAADINVAAGWQKLCSVTAVWQEFDSEAAVWQEFLTVATVF